MANSRKENTQGTSDDNSPNRSESIQTRNYQDEAASNESRLKAVWGEQFGTVKKETIFYRKAVVLLLSWHPDVDDLHTDKEVTELDQVFRTTFHYETVRKELTQGSGPTAQIQVNKHLSDFVFEHDDTNTLLIVYYAGHGRPGESTGGLKLAGNRSLIAEDSSDSSELHEIVWNSAEHNIKATKSDVLVIFDCCHAGELEKNIRSGFTRRAFEYLAATSAKSTTRKPGKHSFTKALIWSLQNLVETVKIFTTQELLTKILHAPDFPDDQSPRLSERGPQCLRRIVLAPLNRDVPIESPEPRTEDEEEGPRMDLSLRFVFNRTITQQMVMSLARDLRQLLSGDEFKARTILWEGINSLDYTTRFYAQRWLRHTRKKSSGASPVDVPPLLEPSGPASSSSESRIATPNQEDVAVEPEIGQDEGLSSAKSAKKRKRSSDGNVVQVENNLTPQKRMKREGRGGRTVASS